MYATGDPKAAGSECDGIVETERCDGSTTTRCQPNDLDAIIAPTKVLPPPTAAWVEELDPSTCLWIASTPQTLFKLIAQWAAETEVLKCCLAACRPGENVIQMKSRQGQLLQGQTVLTTSICHSDDMCTEGLGNTGHTVECLLFVWRSMSGQLHNVARPGFLHQSYLVFRYQCLKLFALS